MSGRFAPEHRRNPEGRSPTARPRSPPDVDGIKPDLSRDGPLSRRSSPLAERPCTVHRVSLRCTSTAGATRYFATIEEHVVEADEPEVETVASLEVRQTFIEIRHISSGQEVVTIIERVSPANKYPGPGGNLYLTKQAEVLASETNLVEIDLLREGRHALAVPEWHARRRGPYDYLICVNRAGQSRSDYELYRRRLRDRLPRIRVPLAQEDADVRVDLQAVFATTYEKGCYRDRLSCNSPCVPPLSPEDQEWANEWIERAARPAGLSAEVNPEE
jgi:hypothetical protein